MRRSICVVVLFAVCISLNTKAQTITTIAGGMQIGYSGDGRPATAAVLDAPQGITADASGNVYFADINNNCVRKISAAGIITTIAGNGSVGYSGDGGQATSAQLHFPENVAVDGSGNIYIVDNSNHCIRKVDRSGVISTFAGTGSKGYSGDGEPATAAQLHYPTGVAADNNGNVYISDAGNYRVRKVDVRGIISTVAGNGNYGAGEDKYPATSSSLGIIYGLAIDLAGNLYIADPGIECVRKIDTAGLITTIAGNHYSSGMNTGGYKGDGGPATAAELDYAEYIAVDNNSNLYIADENNHRIRKVTSDGIISTVAGDGIPGYNGDGENPVSKELYYPQGVATDVNGNLYIADQSNNRIRFLTQSSVFVNPLNDFVENMVNYPNPFRAHTTIAYSLPGISDNVILEVVNVLGQSVYYKNLGKQNMGLNHFVFSEELQAGLYYYSVSNHKFRYTNKMVINK